MIEAKVIADSVSPLGDRLTTMEVTFHRFILPEFNTHRVFSRNSASSRAIPVKKQIKRLFDDPAFPVEFGTNQPGMQAGAPLTGFKEKTARGLWWTGAAFSALLAKTLSSSWLNVHKQVTNRIIEPYMWHTVIVSSTEWHNFFRQRNSPLAQPEIEETAFKMERALRNSTPKVVDYKEYHLPYVFEDEKYLNINILTKISAARCARVSYLTHAGVVDIEKDLLLYDRLVSAIPPHWSPLEHVATPSRFKLGPAGNFHGWDQLRHLVTNGR